jgi:hypothetical protein
VVAAGRRRAGQTVAAKASILMASILLIITQTELNNVTGRICKKTTEIRTFSRQIRRQMLNRFRWFNLIDHRSTFAEAGVASVSLLFP